MIQEVNNALKI